MKKALITTLTLVLIFSLLSGCGKYENGKVADLNEPAITESTKSSDKVNALKKNDTKQPAADTQMQNLSDQMDKLDSITDGLDDSSDINDLEKVINNIF